MNFVKCCFFQLLFLFVMACNTAEQRLSSTPIKEKGIRPPVELKVKFVGWLNEKNKKGMLFKTALINNTSYTVSYMNMSCSYSEAFCTDLSETHSKVEECNKNVPSLYTIGFQDLDKRDATFIFNSNQLPVKHLKFRVGFHFVRADYFSQDDPIKLLKDSTNIIWCNPIQL